MGPVFPLKGIRRYKGNSPVTGSRMSSVFTFLRECRGWSEPTLTGLLLATIFAPLRAWKVRCAHFHSPGHLRLSRSSYRNDRECHEQCGESRIGLFQPVRVVPAGPTDVPRSPPRHRRRERSNMAATAGRGDRELEYAERFFASVSSFAFVIALWQRREQAG